MNASLTSVIRRIGDRFGVRITRSRHTIEAMRTRLLAGNPGLTVLDVGANVGAYGQMLRASGFAGPIVSLEPLPGPFAELSRRSEADPRWRCAQFAAGSVSGTADIHETSNVVSSSLLTPLKAASQVSSGITGTKTSVVQVTRLDDLRGRFWTASDRCWLKLDVQGFEIEALKGAAATLGQTDVIEVELSLAPLYEGQSLMPAVLTRLYDAGFRLVWLERTLTHPTTNHLLEVDGLLVRAGAPVHSNSG